MYDLLNCVTKDDLQGLLTRLVACLSVMVEFLVLLDVLAATNIRISRFFCRRRKSAEKYMAAAEL